MSYILTVIASLLIGFHTPVYCHAPPGGWGDTKKYITVGETAYNPTRIYLRDCRRAVQRSRPQVDTFAHELMHAKHPYWTERHVLALEHWYGGIVLRVLGGT